MGLIDTMRQRSQVLVSIIALALLFFIVRELFGYNPLSKQQEAIVGVVDGQKITLQLFQERLEEAKHNFSLYYQRTPSDQEAKSLQEEIWQQCISQLIYRPWFKLLPIQVTEDELVDMVQGEHIHPDLQVTFTNKKTNEFEKKDLLAYLKSLAQAPMEQQLWWAQVEKQLIESRCQKKLNQLLLKSIFVNGLEATQQITKDSTKVSLRYLYIPYQGVADDQIQINNGMIKQYLDEHAPEYAVPTQRMISYVTFPFQPSPADEKDFKLALTNLQQAFKQTTEDSLFASTHTEDDTNQPFFYATENDLPPALDSLKNSLTKGTVMGPIVDKKAYKLYKVTTIQLDKKNKKTYGLSVIEKKLTASEETKETSFKLAKAFLRNTTNLHQFNLKATQDSLPIYTATLSKDDVRVNQLQGARELVRWAYNTDKIGQPSGVVEIGDQYVVAILTKKIKKGTDTLENVLPSLKNKVTNLQKAAVITEQLKPLMDLPLDSIASQYGSTAMFIANQPVDWRTHTLPAIGYTKKVIPQALSLQEGQRSKIIADDKGIFIVEVIASNKPSLPDSVEKARQDIARMEEFKLFYQLPKALQKLAGTKDYRYRYY